MPADLNLENPQWFLIQAIKVDTYYELGTRPNLGFFFSSIQTKHVVHGWLEGPIASWLVKQNNLCSIHGVQRHDKEMHIDLSSSDSFHTTTLTACTIL